MTSWRECPFLAKVCADQFLPVFGVGPCGAFRSFECCGQVCNIRLAARNVHSFCPDLTCFATKIRRCSLLGICAYLPTVLFWMRAGQWDFGNLFLWIYWSLIFCNSLPIPFQSLRSLDFVCASIGHCFKLFVFMLLCPFWSSRGVRFHAACGR